MLTVVVEGNMLWKIIFPYFLFITNMSYKLNSLFLQREQLAQLHISEKLYLGPYIYSSI